MKADGIPASMAEHGNLEGQKEECVLELVYSIFKYECKECCTLHSVLSTQEFSLCSVSSPHMLYQAISSSGCIK